MKEALQAIMSYVSPRDIDRQEDLDEYTEAEANARAALAKANGKG